MLFISSYSKKSIRIWRYIALIAFFVLTFRQFYSFFFNIPIKQANPLDIFPPITYSILNYIGIFFLIILIFRPIRIDFYGIFAFLYSIVLLIDGCFSMTGILLYCLAVTVLYFRGFYKTVTKAKIILTVAFFLLLSSFGIRYGIKPFFRAFFSSFEYLFLTSIILYIVFEKSALEKNFFSTPVLDLSQFSELTNRDKEWIKLVLTETKYITIANKYNCCEGLVKNRMRKIYKILGVADRLSFMATYSKFNIK